MTLNELRREGRLTDLIVDLESDGRILPFPVHRAVLQSESGYFKDIIEKEPTKPRLVIEYPDPVIFEYIIQWIYGVVPDFLNQFQRYQTILSGLYFDIRSLTPAELFVDDFDQLTLSEPESIPLYFEALQRVFPNKLPKIHQRLLKKIFDNYWKVVGEIDGESLIWLLTLARYLPNNLVDFYNRLKKLVDQGRTARLLELINYRFLPWEYSSRYIGKLEDGPIPELGFLENHGSDTIEAVVIADSVPNKSRYQIEVVTWELKRIKLQVFDRSGRGLRAGSIRRFIEDGDCYTIENIN